MPIKSVSGSARALSYMKVPFPKPISTFRGLLESGNNDLTSIFPLVPSKTGCSKIIISNYLNYVDFIAGSRLNLEHTGYNLYSAL